MTTELSVEHGNRVIERDEQGNERRVREGDYTRVQAGYKAASHNKSLTEDTRKNAEHMLHDLEAQHEQVEGGAGGGKHASTSEQKKEVVTPRQSSEDSAQSHEDAVHQHRVIGGLKANLHRSDRSVETKEAIKEKLRELDADEI
ncbi:hypothetical protein JCM10908_004888 [Rhodotorula pacifica]|uniref:Con-6 family protein n=1 Tax=Rhodotorula pacifica TaxID=1495444 RepID=UPI0031725B17